MDDPAAVQGGDARPPAQDKKGKRKEKHHDGDRKKKDRRKRRGEEAGASAGSGGAVVAAAPAGDEEDWEANRARVEALCLSGPNHICCDCNEAGTRWASVNHGVFVCIRCSGVHRALGVHVSKVKSANMDRWTAAEVALMEAIGNRRGKALYEANLASTAPPTAASTEAQLRAFIEQKYVERAFAASGVEAMVKKIYKKVGYGKYSRPPAAAVGDGGARKTADEGRRRGDAKTLQAEALRAFYGNTGVAAPKSHDRQQQQQQQQGRVAAGEVGGKSAAAADGAAPSHGAAKRGKKGKTVHGTFGVVNVGAEEYAERLAAVLAAFGVAPPEAEVEKQKEEEEEEEEEGGGEGAAHGASPVEDAATSGGVSSPNEGATGVEAGEIPAAAENAEPDTVDAPSVSATDGAAEPLEAAETVGGEGDAAPLQS